jgi:predicted TPR repeat methyltransferase
VSAGAAYARALECWREYRLTDAEEACREALRLQPEFADATALLAEITLAGGAAQLAVMLAERALGQAPDPRFRRLLGRALLAAGSAEEALGVLEGDDASERADVLAELRRAEAAEMFARAVAADPQERVRHARTATRLAASGRLAEAAAVVERGLFLQPGEPELVHLRAAFAGAPLGRAPDEYLTAHFDAFAPSFDERLLGIGYSLPELVPAALARALGGRRTAVLDAGCGTGLLAPGLRPLATRLVGVDLSPGMLARGRATGCYDALAESELVAWLETTDERFGAAVGADLLIYIGAVEALVAGLARVLQPDGVAVLSLEVGGRGSHALETSGRFSHDPGYVDGALAAAGLTPVAHEPCVLRIQSGAPVEGLIVTARREAG